MWQSARCLPANVQQEGISFAVSTIDFTLSWNVQLLELVVACFFLLLSPTQLSALKTWKMFGFKLGVLSQRWRVGLRFHTEQDRISCSFILVFQPATSIILVLECGRRMHLATLVQSSSGLWGGCGFKKQKTKVVVVSRNVL